VCVSGCVYRVAKTRRMPYLYRSFSAKEPPIISGSFAKNDLQLKASYESSPTCIRGSCIRGSCIRVCVSGARVKGCVYQGGVKECVYV